MGNPCKWLKICVDPSTDRVEERLHLMLCKMSQVFRTQLLSLLSVRGYLILILWVDIQVFRTGSVHNLERRTSQRLAPTCKYIDFVPVVILYRSSVLRMNKMRL